MCVCVGVCQIYKGIIILKYFSVFNGLENGAVNKSPDRNETNIALKKSAMTELV